MPDICLVTGFCQNKLENRSCSAECRFPVSEPVLARVEPYPTTLNTIWISPPERNELILRTTKAVFNVTLEPSDGFWLLEFSVALFRRCLLFCTVTLMKGWTAANTVILRCKRPVIQSQTFSSWSPPPDINLVGDTTGMWIDDTYLVHARYKCNQVGRDNSPYFSCPKQ